MGFLPVQNGLALLTYSCFKKKIFCMLFLLITVKLAFSQFPIVYGHDTYDATGRGISVSNDGGILIGGAERLAANADFAGYLRKTDINGIEIWKRYFKQTNYMGANVLGVSINDYGEILVTGSVNSQMDGYAMKLNACGEKIWCRIFQKPSQNISMNNIVLADNGYIIHSNHNQFNYDRIWLYRLDSAGNLLWQKCMEPDTNYFDETGYNLLLTNDSCVLVTGFNFFIREPGSGLGWFSPLWVKFDLEGNQLWDLTWYGDGFIQGDFGRSIQDSKGNYYSGGSDGFQDMDMKACLYKFSPTGVPVKLMHVYPLHDGSLTKALTFFQDSTLFAGGAYAIGNTGYSMVIKSDTIGNIIKTKEVPLYGFPVAYSALTTDNKVVALGERYIESLNHWETCLFKFNQDLEYDSIYTAPRVYDSLCPHAVAAEETINLDCIILDTEEPIKKPENCQLKVYPLPAANQVSIALPGYYTLEEEHSHIKTTTTWYQLNGAKTIEIFNLQGQKAEVYELPDGEQNLTFDVSRWAPGMYLARLVCKGKVWAQGRIMVAR
jgi:hypothetical protein